MSQKEMCKRPSATVCGLVIYLFFNNKLHPRLVTHFYFQPVPHFIGERCTSHPLFTFISSFTGGSILSPSPSVSKHTLVRNESQWSVRGHFIYHLSWLRANNTHMGGLQTFCLPALCRRKHYRSCRRLWDGAEHDVQRMCESDIFALLFINNNGFHL